jgi:hypothetical protein
MGLNMESGEKQKVFYKSLPEYIKSFSEIPKMTDKEDLVEYFECLKSLVRFSLESEETEHSEELSNILQKMQDIGDKYKDVTDEEYQLEEIFNLVGPSVIGKYPQLN